MRISRIYQSEEFTLNKTHLLTKQAAHYVAKVLRLSVGDKIIVFNGNGHEYLAEILNIKSAEVTIKIIESSIKSNESSLKIHLGQGISRGEKMDFTIQKAVELGVSEITPLITKRCGVHLSQERWDKRFQHWSSIIISACEQSGRTIIPKLNPPQSIALWLGQRKETSKFILNPHQGQSLKDIKNIDHDVCLLIGSEGGFEDTEINLAQEAGFVNLRLGPRILRTESAGIAALAILQFQFGDMA